MSRLRPKLLTALRIGIALGLLAYLGLSGAINWPALGQLGRSWQITLGAIALELIAVVIGAWRLCILYRPHGIKLSLSASTRLTLVGMFFSTCLPGAAGGDIVKIYYATEGNHGRRTEVATVMLFDRIVGLFSLMVLPLLFIPFISDPLASSEVLRGLIWSAITLGLGMLIATAVVASTRLSQHRLVSSALRRLLLGAYVGRILDTVHVYGKSPWTLVAAVGASLVGQSVTVALMLLLAQAVSPSGAVWQMALLIPLGLLANSVPLTPGGLGVGEAALSALFAMASLSGGGEVLLSWRLVLLLVGLLGLWVYFQGRKQFVYAPAAGG